MKALILAAWFGTRMLPITKTIPKELLPVGNKPVIQYIVEGVVGAGIDEILILSSQSKKALEDYFDKNYELEELLKKKGKSDLLASINTPKNLARYSFVKQTEQLGTGHAILQAQPWIHEDFFMVIYGDTIFHPSAFQEMIALHQQTGKSVMLVVEVPQQDVSKYGVIKLDDDGHIIDIVEKPRPEYAPSNLIMYGIMILPKKIFWLLSRTPPDEQSGEIYPREAVGELMRERSLIPYICNHPTRDIGSLESWIDANITFKQNGMKMW